MVSEISLYHFYKINTAFRKYFFYGCFYIIRKSHKIIFQCRNCKYIRYYIIAFYGNMVLLSKYSKKQCQNSMKMLRNPSYCDKDNSFHIDAKEGLCLVLYFLLTLWVLVLQQVLPKFVLYFFLFYSSISNIIFEYRYLLWKTFKNCYTIKENIWTAFSGCILIMIALIRILF